MVRVTFEVVGDAWRVLLVVVRSAWCFIDDVWYEVRVARCVVRGAWCEAHVAWCVHCAVC